MDGGRGDNETPMLEPEIRALLPNLTDNNHKVSSCKDNTYNCIALAAGDTANWWWPRDPYYWPPSAPRTLTMDAFCAAYKMCGYECCHDGSVEIGFMKIAIFGKQNVLGNVVPTHAARQMADGRWMSKLGVHQDIEHSAIDNVACPSYGVAIIYMRCRIS
jgi:hypothetical protein